jgi:hypothetical protein
MTGLEILFTLSGLALLGMWGWFIGLGFQTSRLWGMGLIFLFPVSPLMFAYRFERKTRKIIYYFLGALLVFITLTSYIAFTNAEFFENFTKKISQSIPQINLNLFSKTTKVKKLNLPPPAPIPPPLPESETSEEDETVVEIHQPPATVSQNSRYKTIDIDNAKNYLGKSVIVTTAFVTHRGKLVSASGSEIHIKKIIAGGSTIMGIDKSKIEKFEVRL